MTLNRWARAALFTGVLLLSLGMLPIFIVSTFFPAVTSVWASMALVLVTPLGVIIFVLGLIVWIISFWKR